VNNNKVGKPSTIPRVLKFIACTLPIMLPFQNCSNWEAVELQGNLAVVPVSEGVLEGKTLWSQNCQQCHGGLAGSDKRNRTAAQITAAINTVSAMRTINLTDREIATIAEALNPGSTTTPPPVVNPEIGRTEFACTTGDVQKTPLVKLTNREYKNALNALLDGFATTLKSDATLIAKLNSIPTDISVQDRDTNKEQSLLITAPISNALFEAAYRAGELVAGSATGLQNYPNTSQCLAQATVTQTCFQSFIKEFGAKAFRRPLSTTEANALSARFWDSSLAKTDLLKSTVTGIAVMPDFVYKIYDQGTAVSAGVYGLTAHEFATKLAFFLTGAPADATLKALADDGTIMTDSVISAQVDRLIAGNGGKDMIRRLFRESYGYDVASSLAYDASFIGNINTSGLGDVMSTELDNFFVEVVLNQKGSFKDIMTSRYSTFSDSRLATIYGVSAGTGNLPTERAGFLSRAAMLTKRPGFAASPIKRGLNVIEHVLCQDIGLPPPSAPTSLPPVATEEQLTTRLRTQRSTEAAGTTCVGCHGRFNSFGYAFENFDSFGRKRTNEVLYVNSTAVGQLPVDTAVSTSEITGTSVSVSDNVDMVEKLAVSDRAMMCFVKHLKRFESRIAVDGTANCQMNQSLKTMYGDNTTQGSIVGAVKSLVMSAEFRRWKN